MLYKHALDYKFKLTTAFQKALDDTQKQQLPSTTPIPQHQAPCQALTRQHHTKQNTTSPPSPTGSLWDHPPLRG
jgi:hypothetical protein